MENLLIYHMTIAKIDFGTLAILFCLMGVVAGFSELGYFDLMAHGLAQKSGNLRLLMLAIVISCFFLSMLVTNDVGLIIMVPFTIQILHSILRSDKLIKVVVLETIAANLGSMLTPIGNPQNVYLYQYYHMSIRTFFTVIAPYALLSFVLLTAIVWLDKDGKKNITVTKQHRHSRTIGKREKVVKTLCYSIFFVICLLSVMDVLHYLVMLAVVTVGLAVINVRLFRSINYALLGKFVILFVLVGNIADISFIRDNLSSIVSGNEFFMGIGLSQILSNVPTAVMLSKFTSNGTELMLGVDVGGLGTLIASMASMISLEYYGKAQAVKRKKYIRHFTAYNIFFLVCMCGLKLIIG